MPEGLNVLLVEDEENDAELVAWTLKRAGLLGSHWRVDTELGFRAQLASRLPDVILSDFSMPRFNGMRALEIARELHPEIPFIFVSGTIGEEKAIGALKSGATDYILKNNLARLPSAVERAMQDARRLAVQRQMQLALEHSELRFRLAASTGDVWDWTVATGAAYISPQWKLRLGYADDEIENTADAWLALIEPRDRQAVLQAFDGHVKHRIPYDIEYRAQSKSGEYRWSHAKGQAVWDERGRATYMAGSVVDINERKLAELRVKRLNRVYAVLSGIHSLLIRAQNREELFRGACQIAVEHGQFRLAWIGVTDLVGHRIVPVAWAGAGEDYIQRMPLSLDREDTAHWGLIGEVIATSAPIIVQRVDVDPRIVLRDEALARNLQCFCLLPLTAGMKAVGVMALYAGDAEFFDEPEMKLLLELSADIAFALDHLGKTEQLNYLAYYDALTGLANRNLLQDRLSQLMQHGRREGAEQEKIALVLLNIDRFRNINDTLGRHAGDTLLTLVARRLKSLLGSSDRLARIGGDQFAILLTYRKEPAEVAHVLEGKLLASLNQPFALGDKELYITFRVGVAVYPGDGNDAEEIFSNAETASRTAGRAEGRYQFYAPTMNTWVSSQLTIENKLHKALENNEFVLHYQPKVSLQTGVVTGVEALLRWNDPEEGLIAPTAFVSILEETGMIVDVGRWAIRQAMADFETWRPFGGASLRIAVNVSVVQLRQSGFLSMLRDALPGGDQRPCLDLELTESVLMEDIEMNIGKLKAIQAMGINLAVDDFGTGYSSLSYLKRFPINCLKIDQSFVRDITTDPDAAAICLAVIDLAHNLKLKVVAEGVETEGQMNYLRRRGCDEMQGYFFSRPLPADALATLLTERQVLQLPQVPSGQQKRLLIVDDEASILSAMKRLLRREGYEVFTASSAREGFEILARHEIQVILSDQRMPEMSGTEFLSRARHLYPQTIRIVLSGYTDLESIFGAVNEGAIYKFLTKPWDDALLLENLREAFRYQGMANGRDVRDPPAAAMP